jgi:pimeloyl-ACP methyl ester carboxylesterase
MEIAEALDPAGGNLIGVGHSSGAHALLAAEARRPGTFSVLYCYEPMFPAGPVSAPGNPSPNVERTLRRRAHFASRDEARTHFSGRGSFATIAPEALDAFIAGGIVDDPAGGVTLACRPEDEAGILASPIFYDSDTDLSSIACPVHLAYGENNEAQGGRSVRHLAGIVTNASVTGLPGLGHLGPFENPGLVASWIAAIDDDTRAS